MLQCIAVQGLWNAESHKVANMSMLHIAALQGAAYAAKECT